MGGKALTPIEVLHSKGQEGQRSWHCVPEISISPGTEFPIRVFTWDNAPLWSWTACEYYDVNRSWKIFGGQWLHPKGKCLAQWCSKEHNLIKQILMALVSYIVFYIIDIYFSFAFMWKLSYFEWDINLSGRWTIISLLIGLDWFWNCFFFSYSVSGITNKQCWVVFSTSSL